MYVINIFYLKLSSSNFESHLSINEALSYVEQLCHILIMHPCYTVTKRERTWYNTLCGIPHDEHKNEGSIQSLHMMSRLVFPFKHDVHTI